MPGIPPRMPSETQKSRLERWARGWLLGDQGLSGAGKDFIHSIDPRSPQGALGLAGMLVPGKGSGENALAAHLGHSDFRDYHLRGFNEEGLLALGDNINHGGMMHEGRDIGYRTPNGFKDPEIKSHITGLKGLHPDLKARLLHELFVKTHYKAYPFTRGKFSSDN